MKSDYEEAEFIVFELHRFDDDCSKRLRFVAPDQCIFRNGLTWKVVYRSATWAGLERHVHANQALFADKKVVILPANDIEHVDQTPCAQLHAGLLPTSGRKQQEATGVFTLHQGNIRGGQHPS